MSALVSRRILRFSVAFSVLTIAPGFFTAHPPGLPLLEYADLLYLLAPYFTIPAYWFLFRLDDEQPLSHRDSLAFILILIPWLAGFGINWTANAIGHLLKDQSGSVAYRLTYLLDEVLGHYLWNGAVIALSALITLRQLNHPTSPTRSLRLETLAAVCYGFTFFCSLIEGNTACLSLPSACGIVGYSVFRLRGQLWARFPAVYFFFLAHLIALALTAGWALWWGGLPEFSQVGILS